jgi:hypothetical protein
VLIVLKSAKTSVLAFWLSANFLNIMTYNLFTWCNALGINDKAKIMYCSSIMQNTLARSRFIMQNQNQAVHLNVRDAYTRCP